MIYFHVVFFIIDVDECKTNPCIAGRCTNIQGSYICTCPPEKTGKNCEEGIDRLLHSVILSNLKCYNFIFKYSDF